MGDPVTRWQILSAEPESHAEFYRKLFDWSIRADNPMGYRMVDTGSESGIPGGIWPRPPEGLSMVCLYVEVPDVAAKVQEAQELGADVLVPPSTLPGGDVMAVIRDPEGIPVGLWTDHGGTRNSAPPPAS